MSLQNEYSYREYPIRCKSCNQQIACLSKDYESMVQGGTSIEDALDALGLIDGCSRSAMMNPPIVPFNVESREAIEGYKAVNNITEDDFFKERDVMGANPMFNTCIKDTNVSLLINRNLVNSPSLLSQSFQRTSQPPQQLTLPPTQTPTGQTLLQATIARQQFAAQNLTRSSLSTISNLAPRQITTTKEIQKTIELPTAEQDINQSAKALFLDIVTEINPGAGVKINQEQNEFKEPTVVGIPTINPNTSFTQTKVYVGAHKYVEELTGRTFLAR